MTFNIRLIFKQASKKHHSNIQSVSMCFQNLGPPRFIPIIMQVWRLPAWIPARPVSSLSKFQTSKWTGAQSLASSQENRQKWREFCYGFENLKEWGTQLFYAFSFSMLLCDSEAPTDSCSLRSELHFLLVGQGSINPDLHRYCSAVLMEEEALKFTTDDGRCPLDAACCQSIFNRPGEFM